MPLALLPVLARPEAGFWTWLDGRLDRPARRGEPRS
jgi:hypothetical protein